MSKLMASTALATVRLFLDNLEYNNIGSQGMVLVLERQLDLKMFSVSNNLSNSDENEITAEGLRLMPDCNLISQIK